MLDPARESPVTGARKELFEELRKNHVPRYLFRAWSRTSGGGPEQAINTTTSVVPHAFLSHLSRESDNTVRGFYEIPESELQYMAASHYQGGRTEPSGFSSWASSLHLVLCYATSMKPENDPHVAVMETHGLEDEVLVWHVPHLIDRGNDEYLAYGHIKGDGYRAVSLSEMQRNGLLTLLPELPTSRVLSDEVRANMFTQAPWLIRDNECIIIRGIASLSGNISCPMAMALLSLRPREWLVWRTAGVSAEVRHEAVNEINRQLHIESVPKGLHQEAWLQAGMVNTNGFPDVTQWIDLLAMVVDRFHTYSNQEEDQITKETVSKASKRKRSEIEDLVQEQPTVQRPRMELRVRERFTYVSCKDMNCGGCVSCIVDARHT
ncbi:hypothetical protein FB567DRAFT_519002 [Paraphoma chrysanthemicola]|uniref:DUF7587 domain-containing protein n=1 Tax=Paraphoma chrysanthemicola TaxID=798071 RepID=A0A8K0RDF9_9PLEO|nr:hypothetical protein FB567DRAFT_519002 [Paraphoma chrysanthemicola]